MTDRIINTDALKTLIKSINLKSAEAFDENENKYDKFIPTNWLIETINQLSVSAPEPQESIFDADGGAGILINLKIIILKMVF